MNSKERDSSSDVNKSRDLNGTRYVSTIDTLILEEKVWLQNYPQGKEWRDLNDKVIDDREFSDNFRKKLADARKFLKFDRFKRISGISSCQTYEEATTQITIGIAKLLLFEVIEELCLSTYKDLWSTHERCLELLGKVVLNGIMDINEGNKRHLKQTGKIALLQGICSDFTTERNKILNKTIENERLFRSCIVSDLDSVLSMKKKPVKNIHKKVSSETNKESIDTLYLFNASMAILQSSIDRQKKVDLDYWEKVNFYACPQFKYDKRFGRVVMTKVYSDRQNPNNRGSVMVSTTNTGRIIASKIEFRKNTIASELIASNAPQSGKDKVTIIDFKIPALLPNSIITFSSEKVVSIWNLKFIFSEEKIAEQRESFQNLQDSTRRQGLFSCFFESRKRFEIVIEKVFTINQEELSFDSYYPLTSLQLYSSEEKTAMQKVFTSLTFAGSKDVTSEDMIEEKNKELKEKFKNVDKKAPVPFMGSGDKVINRKYPTAFTPFRSIGFLEGEPESILLGTHDGSIVKINLDYLSKQSLVMSTSPSSSLPPNSSTRKYSQPAYFVDKEFVNPNVAPEGFIMVTSDTRPQKSSRDDSTVPQANHVYRELFHFHEASIVLLETIHEDTPKERIISLDKEGYLAIWKYSPQFFQRSCWFTPERKVKISYEIIEFERVSEGIFAEISPALNFTCLQCIEKIDYLPSDSSSRTNNNTKDDEEAEGIHPMRIDSSLLYYPIYQPEENEWIQYEVCEGLFKKRSKRFARVSISHNPRSVSVPALTPGSDPPPATNNPLHTSTSPISSSPRTDDNTLASKVVQRLRNTMMANFQQSRAIKKHIVIPRLKKLKLIKPLVTNDQTELILLLQVVPSDDTKPKKKSLTVDHLYYISSLLLEELVIQKPVTKIELLKGEVIVDFAAGSMLLETLSRPVYVLTDRRVLVYSLATGQEITTALTSKPLITLQRIQKEFSLPTNVLLEKITVCPSNRLLFITGSRSPYYCIYRIQSEMALHQSDPYRSLAFDTAISPTSVQSKEELQRIAISTEEPLEFFDTISSQSTLSESMLDSINEYAVSLTLDSIIQQLEISHQAFVKKVIHTFFNNNLGVIEPTQWPTAASPPEISRSLVNERVNQKLSAKAKLEQLMREGNDFEENSSETSEEGSKIPKEGSENGSNEMNEKNSEQTENQNKGADLDLDSQRRELELMQNEESSQREIFTQSREISLMKKEDVRVN